MYVRERRQVVLITAEVKSDSTNQKREDGLRKYKQHQQDDEITFIKSFVIAVSLLSFQVYNINVFFRQKIYN